MRRMAVAIVAFVLASCAHPKPAPVATHAPQHYYTLPWYAKDTAEFCIATLPGEMPPYRCRHVWEVREWMNSHKAN
jgi:hypothetical protein